MLLAMLFSSSADPGLLDKSQRDLPHWQCDQLIISELSNSGINHTRPVSNIIRCVKSNSVNTRAQVNIHQTNFIAHRLTDGDLVQDPSSITSWVIPKFFNQKIAIHAFSGPTPRTCAKIKVRMQVVDNEHPIASWACR